MRNCEYCGEPLTSRFQTRLHPECYTVLRQQKSAAKAAEVEARKQAQRDLKAERWAPRPCEHCGLPITKLSRADQRYHADCYHLSQIGAVRPEKVREQRICKICKRQFSVGGRAGRRLNAVLCDDCGGKPENRAAAVKLANINCAQCGIEFKPVSSKQRYHDPNCAYEARKGALPGNYKGGRRVTDDGYAMVYMPGRYSAKTRYVMEHRIVMEEFLGRFLVGGETVHHRNDNKLDNRLENLQLRSSNHGKGAAAHCATCGSTDIIFDEI